MGRVIHRSIRRFIIFGVIAMLAFSGCGAPSDTTKEPIEETTSPPTEESMETTAEETMEETMEETTEETAEEPPEMFFYIGTPLDEETLMQYQKIFDEEFWYKQALTSYYATPADVNFRELFYMGIPDASRDANAEEQAYMESVTKGAKYLPVRATPADAIDQVLQKYFGVSFEETNKVKFTYHYFEATDCYLDCTSDANGAEGKFHSGYVQEDGTIMLYHTGIFTAGLGSCEAVVTLRPGDEGLKILSNVPAYTLDTGEQSLDDSKTVGDQISSTLERYFTERTDYLEGWRTDSFTTADAFVFEEEQAHRDALVKSGAGYFGADLEHIHIQIHDTGATVTLLETANYGGLKKEHINHEIQLYMTDDGHWMISQDAYREEISNFTSCSWTEENGDIH